MFTPFVFLLFTVCWLCLGWVETYQTGSWFPGIILNRFFATPFVLPLQACLCELCLLSLSVQVIHQKPKKTLDEITRELCPVVLSTQWILSRKSFTFLPPRELNIEVDVLVQVLSIQQLYRISTMYWDDKYGTHSVSSDVCLTCKLLDFHLSRYWY